MGINLMEHPANFPKVLYCFPESAGKPFMPSNGTDGMVFTEAFCDNCLNQHPDPDNPKQCFEILMKSLCDEQPPEWIFSNEGYPICTAWKKWDWNNNDEGGWNEPPPPEPEDPNQLLLPFDITDLFGFDDPEILVTKKAIIERELVYG